MMNKQIKNAVLVFVVLMTLSSVVQSFLPSSIRQPTTKTFFSLTLSKDDKENSNKEQIDSTFSRRQVVSSLIGGLVATTTATTCSKNSNTVANAVVTDETDNFGENWWTGDISKGSPFVDEKRPKQSQVSPSDEIVIKVSKNDLKKPGGLGLELGEVEFRTNIRVFVKSVAPGSLAERLGIQKDWVVVSVNNQSAERTDASGVAVLVYRAVQSNDGGGGDGDNNESIEFRFRDPAIFQNKLRNLSAEGVGSEITTQVAPSGDTTQRNVDGSIRSGWVETEQEDQRVTVSQLIPPKLCRRGADTDDLLEISYIGRVLETGAIFDGSAVTINGNGIAGRGNDVSVFFVLGKQPFGQFPPGWDVGLVGMCVGERRRLILPPALAYGAAGLPRRGIPPNATMQYDVTLVSLNGLATPQ